MKYKLAIFDLDGTLANTIEDLARAVDYALATKSLPGHSLEEYKTMVGGGVRNLVWKAMPEDLKNDDALLESLLSEFMSFYKANICVSTRAYPGVAELLTQLNTKGVKLAVASNKFEEGSKAIVNALFPDVDFVCVRGGRPGFPLKPDPSVLAEIIQESDTESEYTVMIGDSGTDTKTAAAAGVASVAVTWGFKPASAVVGATHIAANIAELRKILLA